MATVFATVTTPGPPGPTGPPGYSPVYIVAAGPPSSGVGSDHDMYINSSTGDVYGPKIGGVWGPIVCNIKGPTGATGATGPAGYSPQYIVAAGPPSGGQGNNGDMYINSTTSDVYGPKASGAWGGIVCNIKGIQGPPGVAYTPRGAWVSTTTYAQGDEVTYNSQLFIALQSANLNNVPATSPTWWQLVGSGGAQTPWLSDIDGATFILKNAGKVGVGILPTSPVHVHGAATPAILVEQTANTAAIELKDSAATPNRWWLACGIGTTTDGKLGLYDARQGVSRLTVDTAGYIGIGTASPAVPLHIYQAAGTLQSIVRIHNAGGGGGGTDTVSLELMGGGATTYWSLITNRADVLGAADTIGFYKNAGTVGVKLAILNSGNVGIGTVTPSARLQVTGDVTRQLYLTGATTPTSQLRVGYDVSNNTGVVEALNSGGARPLLLNPSSGNVGIGTVSPGTQLQVAGHAVGSLGQITIQDLDNDSTGSPACAVTGMASDGTRMMFLGYAGGGFGKDLLVWNDRLGAVRLGTNGTERVRIDTVGNVGIGTAAPGALLDVAGGDIRISNGRNLIFNPASDSGIQFFGGTTINRRSSDGSLLITAAQGYCWITSISGTLITGGNVAIGATTAYTKLAVIPTGNPSTPATAVQISVGEASNNPLYRLELGYYYSGSAYNAVIQAAQNGPATGVLLLNPGGGTIGIGGKIVPGYAVDVQGDVNVSGAFRVNGVAIGAGGVGVQINSSASLGIYQYLNFFAMSGINITGGGPGGPGNNTYTIQFGTSSDLQLKRNVQTLSGGLAIINQLRPITAEWNGLAGMREGQRLISIIAQDLREVIPDAVEAYRTKLRPEDSEETELLAYDPMAITSHLILAVQQLLRRLEALEQKVT